MSGPDYLNRRREPVKPTYLGKDPTSADWRKHEKDVEKRSGDRRRRASGAAPGKPGDNAGMIFLREDKATKGAGITIQGKWLKKLVGEALPLGLIPVLEIRLEGQEAPVPTDWILMPALEGQEALQLLQDRG